MNLPAASSGVSKTKTGRSIRRKRRGIYPKRKIKTTRRNKIGIYRHNSILQFIIFFYYKRITIIMLQSMIFGNPTPLIVAP